MKLPLILLSVIAVCLAVPGQQHVEKSVADVHNFETDWLSASLNSDTAWIDRFTAGKLTVVPAEFSSAKERTEAINAIINPTLQSREMKVRITGTISLLTSDPAKNRSFGFLDTFNKKNSKWQVVATSMRAVQESAAGSDRKAIEEELTRLENAWAQVDVTNDRSIFDHIIAPDFVATSASGKVRNREEWTKSWEYEGLKNAVNKDLSVHVYSDTLAVVTGIDVTTRTDNGVEVVHEDRFTDTWLKRGGGWQVIAAQVIRLK
jgi:ketosteroid isomerase-like protein